MNSDKTNFVVLESHITPKKFICDVCQKDFVSKFHYHIHLVIHFAPEDFDCSNCQEGLDYILNFNKQLEIHSNANCHARKKEFFDDVSKKEHVEIQNSESEIILISQENPANEEFAVETHNNTLSYDSGNTEKYALIEDTSRGDLQNIFRCQSCKEEFSEKDQLESYEFEDLMSIKSTVDNSLQIANNNEPITSYSPDITKNISSENFNVPEKLKTFNVEEQKDEDKKEAMCFKIPSKIKHFICKMCKKYFLTKRSLSIHASSHTKKKTFPCHLCEKKFTFDCFLNAHLQTHQVKQFNCGVCQKSYDSKDKLFDHVHTHAIVESFLCNICQETFSEKGLLDSHSLCHIPKKVFNTHMRSHFEPRVHVCKICSKKFNNATNLNRHNLIHTGEKPFKCESCGACFNQKSSLTRHELRRHKVSDSAKKEILEPDNVDPDTCILKCSGSCIHLKDKPFKCETCEKHFISKKSLKAHQRIHTGEKPYVCDTCKKSFLTQNNLISHQCLHFDEKTFLCETCKKSFLTKNDLISHQILHFEEKPYLCETCGKRFTRKCTLQLHCKTHLEQRPLPFQCETCKKKFALKFDLKRHLRMHTGERPFLCDLCDQRFKQRSHLKYHSWSIHGKESASLNTKCSLPLQYNTDLEHRPLPFHCETCEKRFALKFDLKRHLRMHTGERPFMCDSCDQRFKQRSHLKYHSWSIHCKESASLSTK